MSAAPRVLALADHLGHADGRIHGATTYYLNVYPALKRAGVALTVAFLAKAHPAAAALRDEGIEPLFLNTAKWNFAVFRDVLSLIDRYRIQVLHLAAFKSHFLGRLAASRRGCRTIVHLHDTVPLPAHVKCMQRLVRRRTDLALAVSGPVGELGMREYGFAPDIVRTLHNAIEPSRMALDPVRARAEILAELALDDSVRLIGMIGRLAPMKGHRHMLEALPRVLCVCPNARLLVVGEGALRSALEMQVQRSGLKDAVIFAGQRGDIPRVLAALDVVAMPSVAGEGLPYAAIEAIACGVPVVAYPTAGIPEVVPHDRAGLLVAHGDVAALGSGIVRVLRDDALHRRLSQGAREHARGFTVDRHVGELVSIYRQLAQMGAVGARGLAGAP